MWNKVGRKTSFCEGRFECMEVLTLSGLEALIKTLEKVKRLFWITFGLAFC